jgi:phospholipase C
MTPHRKPWSRRQFLRIAAGAGSAVAVGAQAKRPRPFPVKPVTPVLPAPSGSGIRHIVVVMMENRSFDHFLGWLPGANGLQPGLIYFDSGGQPHNTFALATDTVTGVYQGCGLNDPDHSYEGGRVEFNNGACDGWRMNGANAADDFSIGYYTEGALDFLGRAARDWTVCDNYFAGVMAETYPNRFHMHAAATDRLHNHYYPSVTPSQAFIPSTLPTIWDRLAANGYRGRYYYGDTPFLALWGATYLNISFPIAQFFADAAAGNLPEVAFIDPRFQDESSGSSADDHPHADIRAGEYFLSQIYNAMTTSPNWASSVLIVNYDEWGGFYDHVVPPLVGVPPATLAAAQAENLDLAQLGLLGFRTPNLIVSPFARRGFVSSKQFDHTSILRMIEWRFGLPPLTVRDQNANNIADALDFAHPDLAYNTYSVPAAFTNACTGEQPPSEEDSEFDELQMIAQKLGFVIPGISP